MLSNVVWKVLRAIKIIMIVVQFIVHIERIENNGITTFW